MAGVVCNAGAGGVACTTGADAGALASTGGVSVDAAGVLAVLAAGPSFEAVAPAFAFSGSRLRTSASLTTDPLKLRRIALPRFGSELEITFGTLNTLAGSGLQRASGT